MLYLVLVGLMLFAGARRWTPLAPLYTALFATAAGALQLVSSSAWRAEAGLAAHSAADLAPGLLISVAILFGAYWAARGAASLVRR